MKYKWNHDVSKYQEYYDVVMPNGDYLCVFRNLFEKVPNTWMGFIQDHKHGDQMIHNKTRNDRQRRKQGLPLRCETYLLHIDCMLTNTDPVYMMKKVERCYAGNKREICE